MIEVIQSKSYECFMPEYSDSSNIQGQKGIESRMAFMAFLCKLACNADLDLHLLYREISSRLEDKHLRMIHASTQFFETSGLYRHGMLFADMSEDGVVASDRISSSAESMDASEMAENLQDCLHIDAEIYGQHFLLNLEQFNADLQWCAQHFPDALCQIYSTMFSEECKNKILTDETRLLLGLQSFDIEFTSSCPSSDYEFDYDSETALSQTASYRASPVPHLQRQSKLGHSLMNEKSALLSSQIIDSSFDEYEEDDHADFYNLEYIETNIDSDTADGLKVLFMSITLFFGAGIILGTTMVSNQLHIAS